MLVIVIKGLSKGDREKICRRLSEELGCLVLIFDQSDGYCVSDQNTPMLIRHDSSHDDSLEITHFTLVGLCRGVLGVWHNTPSPQLPLPF